MTPHSPPASGRTVPSRALLPFVAITFAVTWGTIGFYIVWPGWAEAWFGEISGSHPAFFLATWAPGIAALVVVLTRAGVGGTAAFLSRLSYWRCPGAWAVFVILGIPAVFVAGSLLQGGGVVAPIHAEGVSAVLGATILMLFLGPVEELGWRGVAQPILQRHVPPVVAGLLIGATWGLWHLPAFYLAGTVQSGWNFAPFFLGNVALSVLVTPLFNASRGSILLPVLFHWQLINPLWPDARPYDTYLLVLLALGAVWLNRDTMFRREGAYTHVVPPRPGPGTDA